MIIHIATFLFYISTQSFQKTNLQFPFVTFFNTDTHIILINKNKTHYHDHVSFQTQNPLFTHFLILLPLIHFNFVFSWRTIPHLPMATSFKFHFRNLLSLRWPFTYSLSQLLPPRHIDHHINLLPNLKLVNTWPYRYPYFQKNEIEFQIQNMLDNKLIQHS